MNLSKGQELGGLGNGLATNAIHSFKLSSFIQDCQDSSCVLKVAISAFLSTGRTCVGLLLTSGYS